MTCCPVVSGSWMCFYPDTPRTITQDELHCKKKSKRYHRCQWPHTSKTAHQKNIVRCFCGRMEFFLTASVFHAVVYSDICMPHNNSCKIDWEYLPCCSNWCACIGSAAGPHSSWEGGSVSVHHVHLPPAVYLPCMWAIMAHYGDNYLIYNSSCYCSVVMHLCIVEK